MAEGQGVSEGKGEPMEGLVAKGVGVRVQQDAVGLPLDQPCALAYEEEMSSHPRAYIDDALDSRMHGQDLR
jgi:hypothetical protein